MNNKITLVIGVVFLLTMTNIGSVLVTFGQAGVGSSVPIKDESPHFEMNYDNCKFPNPFYDFTWEAICYTVFFTDNSSGTFINWTWDFTNDGVVDDWGKNVVFTYSNYGVYEVKYCVQDTGGRWFCLEKYIKVGYPIVDFQWEADGLKVTFTDDSTDCDGEITFRGWSFTNDGHFDDFGEEVIHEYPEPGTYTVKLVVQDNNGNTDSITKEVTVTQSVADLDCEGTLYWSNVKPGEEVLGSFMVSNIGNSDSELDWEIESYPDWGSWEFTPESGDDLSPGDDTQVVEVAVTTPDEKNKVFSGEIKVVNKNNPSDYEIIPITLTTLKNKAINTPFLQLLENHPFLFLLLRQLLRL